MSFKTRQYLYGFAAVISAGYLAWSLWGLQPQTAASGFVAAKPAILSAKVPGPTIQVKVVPKSVVKKKFPQAHIEGEGTEVIDTTIIPPAPDGATTITTIDPDGEARTEIMINQAPWFALQRKNYLGAGYELHLNGEQKIKLYYKRDLARVKDLYLQAEAQIKIPTNFIRSDIEGYAGGNVEYRF